MYILVLNHKVNETNDFVNMIEYNYIHTNQTNDPPNKHIAKIIKYLLVCNYQFTEVQVSIVFDGFLLATSWRNMRKVEERPTYLRLAITTIH